MATPLMPILEGTSLENYIQQFVAGISGLDGTMVRPRWQPEPPNIPDFGVNWAAVGIMRHRPIGTYPAVIHHPEGDGYDEMQRHEELDILVSFYGASANEYANNLHNGLMIWQNFSVLRLVSMALVEVSEGTHNPELIRERWWDRVDKPMILRRLIRRTYPVLNLVESRGFVVPDPGHGYQAPWIVSALSAEAPTHWDNDTTAWDVGGTIWDLP
jgi:hypothetical protein